MNDCIFCKIINNEIPYQLIYEDDSFMAILDIAQFEVGHTIVIPKSHYKFIWDIPNVGEYMEFIKKVSLHYTENLGYKYVDTASFGRMVPHAHMHLIPHNDKEGDWSKSISLIGDMQGDEKRRKSIEEFVKIGEKFRIN